MISIGFIHWTVKLPFKSTANGFSRPVWRHGTGVTSSQPSLTAPYSFSSETAHVPLLSSWLLNLVIKQKSLILFNRKFSLLFLHQSARSNLSTVAQNRPIAKKEVWRNLQMAVKRILMMIQAVWNTIGVRASVVFKTCDWALVQCSVIRKIQNVPKG